jgi:hypothetical protein
MLPVASASSVTSPAAVTVEWSMVAATELTMTLSAPEAATAVADPCADPVAAPTFAPPAPAAIREESSAVRWTIPPAVTVLLLIDASISFTMRLIVAGRRA